jgi:N-acetylmuramoyl-L-alanine amidase
MAAGNASASSLRISDALSPENAVRPLRAETRYIVLHTTEGREAGSLHKLRRRGETHYFVYRDGRVARVIDRRRVATHAGLSMWAGQSDLDQLSVAIEVSGYHDKEPTAAQYTAVRELLRQLQSLYHIPDNRVLTHSMVAYGAPNRFYPHRHRGRKRCGMIFANPQVRRRLGLTAAPSIDPDVAAGRLRVGDVSLHRILYPTRARTRIARAKTGQPVRHIEREKAPVSDAGDVISRERTAWKIAGSAYADASTVYVFPDGTRTRGDAIRQWDSIPAGTRVLLGQTDAEGPSAGESAVAEAPEPDETGIASAPEPEDGLLLLSQPIAASELLGDAATAKTTTYLFPSGGVHTGAELDADPDGQQRLESLPAGTRVLVGYVGAGRVSRDAGPRRVAGDVWDDPTTYYRIPSGALRTGTELTRGRVPTGTLVFVPE